MIIILFILLLFQTYLFKYECIDSHLSIVSNKRHFQNCCDEINDPNKLYQCLIDLDLNSNTKKIIVITSITSNILDYASYPLYLNAYYALIHQYKYIIKTDKDNFDPDARWNKIKYLFDEVENRLNNAEHFSEFEYLVWLDADLAIIDPDLDLEELVYANIDRDIFMSKDIASAPFVSNTGFIIVKISEWSKEFLRMWWESYDRSQCCDQNALTWLYDRKVPYNIEEKILFLPANKLNSDFPCWKSHTNESQVVHLAGLTSLYRVDVFSKGVRQLCLDLRTHSKTSQYSITLEYLNETIYQLNSKRIARLQDIIHNILESNEPISYHSTKVLWSHIHDITKYDDQEIYWGKPAHYDNEISQINKLSATILFQLYLHFEFVIDSKQIQCSHLLSHCIELLELYKDFISCAFEYVLMVLPIADNYDLNKSMDILNNLHNFIQNLLETQLSEEKVEARFTYYLFKTYQLKALVEGRLQQDRYQTLLSAAKTWTSLVDKHQFYGTNYVLADPEKEYFEIVFALGVLSCQKKEYQEGIKYLNESIFIIQNMISGYEKIRIISNDIITKARFTQIDIFYDLAVCYFQTQENNSQAIYYFHKVLSSMLALNISHSSKLFNSSLTYLSKLESSSIHGDPRNNLFPEEIKINQNSVIIEKTIKKFRKRKKD